MLSACGNCYSSRRATQNMPQFANHWYERTWLTAISSRCLTALPVLRSEIPSGICAKLRTVAASNNRVHMPWSLYYCLFAPHISMVLFFTHIPFVVNRTFNATPLERLQHWFSWILNFIIKFNNAFTSPLAILAALDSNLVARLGLRKYSPSFICTSRLSWWAV